MGDVEGVFVADPAEIEKAVGKRVYFGEILGKHSEIYGQLEVKDLTVVSDSQEVINIFMEVLPDGTGYNPLNYIDYYCEECGELLEEGECWRCEE